MSVMIFMTPLFEKELLKKTELEMVILFESNIFKIPVLQFGQEILLKTVLFIRV